MDYRSERSSRDSIRQRIVPASSGFPRALPHGSTPGHIYPSGASASTHLQQWSYLFSEEGKVRKILKAEPLPDGSGHFFNLSVQNRLLNVDESIYIPVTKAEFTVLISAFNFILPYLLGWHAFANSTKPDDSARSNNANPRSGSELEWGR